MDKEKELPKRKPTRLQEFDYNTTGAYFITICTDQRRQILSHIVGVDVLGDPQNVELLPHGMVADKYIKQMNGFYQNITVDQYVIMPNHIHLVSFACEDGSPRTSTPTRQTTTVSHFVSTFKRFCNKEYGGNIWQRGFYDHVIRGREDYEEIAKYIYENPIRWYYDELYTEE
ncbi:MAG: transposase [Clostridia bacterium]|nr:transposase [Clostridia bacterium]